MKQSNQDNRANAPVAPAKRPYRKPSLVVHGDVSRITGFVGVRGRPRTPVGGLYSHS